ncbi:MAG: alpha/beta hydrolase [Thermomicrobium sp.]|nr:alpha/beta hydrolase [Thermomicrobium sp.]
MSLRHAFVPVDGLSLFVLTAGENRLPLLILHGFASSALTWVPVIRALATDRMVVAYDRPGFGLTQVRVDRWRGRDPYAPSAQTAIALALADCLGLTGFVVLGHSMGARLAYELALASPGRIRGLAVVAPAWTRPSAPRLAPLLRTRIARAAAHRLLRLCSPIVQRAAQRVLWAGSPPPGSTAHEAAVASIAGWEERLWHVTTASLAESRAEPPLRPPTVPTMVILGEHDRVVPNQRTLDIVTAWNAAGTPVEIRRFTRSGHLPHVEEFERFIEEVRTFLEEVNHAAAPGR